MTSEKITTNQIAVEKLLEELETVPKVWRLYAPAVFFEQFKIEVNASEQKIIIEEIKSITLCSTV